MNQRNFILQTVCLLLFVLACAPASCAAQPTEAKPTVDLRQPPNAGGDPVEVAVGLYITNFVNIDETRETFEVGGFLTAQWHDPRLVARPDQPQGIRSFNLGDIWAPAIEGANVVSHKMNQYTLEADKNGLVTYRERFDAVYSNDFALRRFPFDSQVLRFEYLPFLSSGSQIRFAPQALPFTGMSPSQHTELAAWRLEDLRYTTDKVYFDPYQPDSREAMFQVTATRRSAFYVWKIFLPLIMITLIPTAAFWIDVKEFDWILKIPMTMLLSMVAFQFTVTRDLPRIGYITFLDAVFLAGFVFCFLAVFEITLVYLLQRYNRRPLAVKLHSAGKWAYPLGYLGVIAVLAVGFLG